MRRRTPLAILLVALLGFAAAAGAEQERLPRPLLDPHHAAVASLNHPVDVSGNLLATAGDDPAFAKPDYDDSHWTVLETSHSLTSAGLGFHDVVWYRTHVRIPPGSHEVSLLLRNFIGSPLIYVNGVLTGPNRDQADGGRAYPNMDISAPLPDAVIAGGDLVIAVRAELTSARHSLAGQPGFSATSVLLLGDTSVLKQERLLNLLLNYASNLTDIAFTLVVLVITLALWIALRREREYLYLAIYLASTVVSGVLTVYTSWHDLVGSTAISAPAGLIVIAGVIAGLEFARIVLGVRRARWFVIYQYALGGMMLLSIVSSLVFTGASKPPMGVLWIMLALYALASGSLILGLPLFALWRWYKTRNFDALLLSLPLLARGTFFYAWLGYTMFSIFRYKAVRQLPTPPLGPFSVSWSEVTDFFFLASLLLFLILRTMRLARARASSAAEIAAAQNTQLLLLARASQPTPGFAVQTAYLPASEVGGDFFLVSPDPADGSLVAVLGDVSGKGLTAAMRVAMILGALEREPSRSPSQILAALNEILLTQSELGFTTACCVHLAQSGAFRAANAGHIAPYVNGVQMDTPPSLPLGLVAQQYYPEVAGTLPLGAHLTIVSDGVAEARDRHGALFGFERIPALTLGSAESVAATAQSFGQEDDITVLTIACSECPPAAAEYATLAAT